MYGNIEHLLTGVYLCNYVRIPPPVMIGSTAQTDLVLWFVGGLVQPADIDDHQRHVSGVNDVVECCTCSLLPCGCT